MMAWAWLQCNSCIFFSIKFSGTLWRVCARWVYSIRQYLGSTVCYSAYLVQLQFRKAAWCTGEDSGAAGVPLVRSAV